jgi:splicing factor U2AF subunit
MYARDTLNATLSLSLFLPSFLKTEGAEEDFNGKNNRSHNNNNNSSMNPHIRAQKITSHILEEAQATRHARRVYVGGFPPNVSEVRIADFFNNALMAVGGIAETQTEGNANPVVNVYMNHEKHFAFVEFRNAEETSNCMALDSISFDSSQLRVRRPNDDNQPAAMKLGPIAPNIKMNLEAIGLSNEVLQRMQSGVASGQSNGNANGTNIDPNEDRVFVGGLPYFLTEAQIRELLEAFGPITRFDLVRDRDTGGSKGYGFVVYRDGPAITDIAIQGLHGMQMGDKQLTVRRANVTLERMQQEQRAAALQQQQQLGNGGAEGTQFLPQAAAEVDENATECLVLKNMGIKDEELNDPEEYEIIVEDTQEECEKFGKVLGMKIPKPPSKSAGIVFVRFDTVESARKARKSLNGRKFAGNVVSAEYDSIETYEKHDS